MPQHAVAGTPSNFLVFVFGTARPPVSFSFTKHASSNVNHQLMLLWNNAWHTSLIILQSAIIVMPGYISRVKRSLKVSHSSCMKIVEPCLEIVDCIPKPLQQCNGSGSILKARWDSGYGPIIIPATSCPVTSVSGLVSFSSRRGVES